MEFFHRYLHITFTLNLSMNECSSSFTDIQIVFGYQIFDIKIVCRAICRDEFSIVISMVWIVLSAYTWTVWHVYADQGLSSRDIFFKPKFVPRKIMFWILTIFEELKKNPNVYLFNLYIYINILYTKHKII